MAKQTAPLQVVVMGVAGTGKSTVGAALATALGFVLVEGDDHHPQSNLEKMSSGRALTDEDRLPWLRELARLLADNAAAGRSSVLACSALRRRYRDVLRGDLPEEAVFFVHLRGGDEILAERMRDRTHFMPVSLLRSQTTTLEPLEADERGVEVDVALPVEDVVARVRESLPGRRLSG